MAANRSETVICTYRVRRGRESAFRRLLDRHWPALRRLKLVTPERPVLYRGRDEAGGSVFVEIFTWRDRQAAGEAHEAPAVMAIWERMEPLTEARQGRPGWEFPHFRRVRPAARG